MELVVAFVSALLGMSVAFFLSVSFYDFLPEGWRSLVRLGRPSALEAMAGARHPMIPRTIRHTQLD
jgi:hypothetical protein